MNNAITFVSLGIGSILIILVIIGTCRLVKKTKNYNPDYDINEDEKFFDEDED